MSSCAVPTSQTMDAAASMRRGACPSLAAPMPTGDGLLVRLRPLDGSLTLSQFSDVAEAARQFGNGILEITARGNLQVRRLTASTVPGLAQAIGEAAIVVPDGVAIETPPLAGIDPEEIIDPRILAAVLRKEIAARGAALRLAPKLAIIVDGGGRFHLGDTVADLRLQAVGRGGDVWWNLSLAGTAATAKPICALRTEAVVPIVIRILAALTDIGPAARGRDLEIDAVQMLCPVGADFVEIVPAPMSVSPVVGIHDLGSTGAVLGLGLAFAQIDAISLIALLRQAAELGAREIRLAPGHSFFMLGLEPEAAEIVQRLALAQGFRIAADDPRNHIATCAGSTGCASAWMDTKAMARLWVETAPDLLDGSLTVHLSGCVKGCARPKASALTLVGAPSGYALVVNGAAKDGANAYTDENGMKSALERLAGLVRENKDAGESARSCLTRLGAARVSAAFEQG
ncbi:MULTISPECIES: precorrin-3B synthase [Ensifer]|jgi:precorrin-3B synthase|uniref:Precorrin-3B synthase n=1 Tax=Ensifer canadensis TaxID=555315 RepID=A0AAW4FTY9_9HYPH|nr:MULTISPECIES: precorrin-3B synthase [Ensifer]KQU82169.1 precorrin-3B synthase [Ensifer sp. Root31]KQW55483.1 precorrin-3B synthase [Ensifer sp. Root1252]KQW73611.1 precorrin-3B synthase [Ensifer sp. Root127]KRC71969.1 precorrin-3B synthase [Ensifer sp. Root231]KRC90774.1 precorrin-3B synthase [Ensifer sp. Root258]